MQARPTDSLTGLAPTIGFNALHRRPCANDRQRIRAYSILFELAVCFERFEFFKHFARFRLERFERFAFCAFPCFRRLLEGLAFFRDKH